MIVTALVLATSVPAAPVDPVAATVVAYRDAWNHADAAGLARLFSPDGVLDSVGGTVAGRAAIEQYYAGAFAAGTAGGTIDARVDRRRALGSDLIFARGAGRIAPPGTGPVCLTFTAVLRRARAGWRIDDFSESGLACAAAGF